MKPIELEVGDKVVDLDVDEEGNPQATMLEVISVDAKAGKRVVDFHDGSYYWPHDDDPEFSVFRDGEWL